MYIYNNLKYYKIFHYIKSNFSFIESFAMMILSVEHNERSSTIKPGRYMLASIIAFTALARILYSNTSEIIIFIRSNSENADHAFFALNFFINLLLFSHLAFILISGLAKGKNIELT